MVREEIKIPKSISDFIATGIAKREHAEAEGLDVHNLNSNP